MNKAVYTLLLVLLCIISLLHTAHAAKGESDSMLWTHQRVNNGPISLFLSWVDSSDENYWKNATHLKAAVHAGGTHIQASEFSRISRDYKIRWSTFSEQGYHHLSVTFAKSESKRAISLLKEMLADTDFGSKAASDYARQKAYHYNFYRNDPDSALQWWMNNEAKTKNYLSNWASEKPSNLLGLLGKPCFFSSVGPIRQSSLRSLIPEAIFPQKSKPSFMAESTKSKEKKGASVIGRFGYKLKSQHPISTHAQFQIIRQECQDCMTQFSFRKNYGFIISKDSFTLQEIALKSWEHQVEKSRLQYQIWLEKNRNLAQAKSFEKLGLWAKKSDYEPEQIRRFKITARE